MMIPYAMFRNWRKKRAGSLSRIPPGELRGHSNFDHAGILDDPWRMLGSNAGPRPCRPHPCHPSSRCRIIRRINRRRSGSCMIDRVFYHYIAEPSKADCFFQSCLTKDGTPAKASGDLNSMMAGLRCASCNPIAWNILRDTADVFAVCPDSVAAKGMRILGNPMAATKKFWPGSQAHFLLVFVRRYRAKKFFAEGFKRICRLECQFESSCHQY